MLNDILVGRARSVIPHYLQFEAEARKDGARVIEAEHMLLALATNADEAGRLLLEAGLDHERLAAALRDEHRQSLAFAGMQPLAQGPAEVRDADRPVSLGTSAKTALKRALAAHHQDRSRRGRGRGRPDTTDLLIGLLQAELGTVPRVLAIAGADRSALIARARGGESSRRAC
jgi:ATP-dependent Clp protease ATP-binding subunit ClpA